MSAEGALRRRRRVDRAMIDFSLIETMRWEPGTGIVRARLHLARLKRSASRLGLPGAEAAAERLAEISGGTATPLRIRLELFPDGRIDMTTAPFTPLAPGTVWTVAIANTRLSSTDKL